MIYFDNAATGGKKPDTVLTAVHSAIRTCANPGRSGHKLSLSCAKWIQECRNALTDFFDGYGVEQVVFTKNCTEALNIALLGCLRRGDHVITTCMEHNSVLRPLEFLKKSGIITYDVCTLDHSGNISPTAIASLIKPNTKLAAITSASNVTGATPPLKKIRAILPENILLLVDGAQGCGHFDIKMKGAGIDILTVAGHKGMLGIQGSGALLFSDRVAPAPLLHGGTGSLSISLDDPDFYPDCLEAGTLSTPAILSLLEGTRYLLFHQAEMGEKVFKLTEYALRGIRALPAYRLYSTPNICGIVAFAHKTIPSEFIAERLSEEYGIAVRGGLHCAPLMHAALGTQSDGLVRVSLSAYNTRREVELLLSALRVLASE